MTLDLILKYTDREVGGQVFFITCELISQEKEVVLQSDANTCDAKRDILAEWNSTKLEPSSWGCILILRKIEPISSARGTVETTS